MSAQVWSAQLMRFLNVSRGGQLETASGHGSESFAVSKILVVKAPSVDLLALRHCGQVDRRPRTCFSALVKPVNVDLDGQAPSA